MTTEQITQLANDLKRETNPDTYHPVASDESKDSRIFWGSDPCDDVMPSQRGFTSDCVYYTRGKEVASLFIIWSSLFAISSVVKRDAWKKWGDKQLYPNLYFMLVAPAGAVKKNTATDMITDLIDYIDTDILAITGDENVAGMKRINPYVSTSTQQALVTQMLPENQRGTAFDFRKPDGSAICDANGNAIRYYPRSEIVVCQRELGAFAGRSSYMESLIPFLTDMYDCPNRWHNATQARGKEEVREVMVNFMGGIAPAALKETLPVPATADGFLSRCLIVYQNFTEREFFEPTIPDDAPQIPELRKRLAWIAANTFGEWEFTKEARVWAERWYHKYKQQLAIDGLHMGVKSRLDTILYRVAMLIRWQRYERNDQFIHICDLEDAGRLIMRTFAEAIPIYRMLFDDKSSDKSLKVEEYIRRVKKVNRRDLIQKAHVPAEDAWYAVTRLVNEGVIKIWYKDRLVFESTRDPYEVYEWVEEQVARQRAQPAKSSPSGVPAAQPFMVKRTI